MSIFVSLLTAGTNNHEETSENANAIATDFVSEGVIGTITNTSGVAPSTGAFAVNAQSTPDMTVEVSSGVAYVTGTPTSQDSQTFRVRLSTDTSVTISSNSSGSTKYDWVYIKLDADKMANPGVDADDVATLVTSRSSSSTSDNGTPPTYGYPIAVITVANSASSISNANITDKRSLSTSTQDGTVTASKLALGAKVATIATSETTTSTSYADLTTTTDTVTVTIGANGAALVVLTAELLNSGATNTSRVSFAASSSNTISASDANALVNEGTNDNLMSFVKLLTGLTAGSTVFKMKYRVTGGTGTFLNRSITVLPL